MTLRLPDVSPTVRRRFALCVVAVAGWLSLTPVPPKTPGMPEDADLVAHLVMHAGVAGAIASAWPPSMRVLAATIALALTLETAQLAVPGRTFSFADLAMNCVGAALGATVVAILGAAAPARR